MVVLIEAKINSLPPELITTLSNPIIPEIKPVVVNTTVIQHVQVNKSAEKDVSNKNLDVIEEAKNEEAEQVKEDTPEQALRKYVDSFTGEEFNEMEAYYKMLKFGIPTPAVLQKAQFNNYNIKNIEVRTYIFKNFKILVEKYKAANPHLNL